MGCRTFRTGDLLRQAIQCKTDLGRVVQGFMERGDLVPDEFVVRMIEERIEESDCGGGFLLDGFPRNLAQAQSLDRMLAKKNLPLNHVVSLEVAYPRLIERLGGRRNCEGCGALYHVTFDPPSRSGVCDHCGAPLVQRADDCEDTIRARLDVFDRDTVPLRSYYRERNLLREVDGSGDRDEVFARIRGVIDGR